MSRSRWGLACVLTLVASVALNAEQCAEINRVEQRILLRVVYQCTGISTQDEFISRAKQFLTLAQGDQKFKEVIVGADKLTLDRSVLARIPANHLGAGMEKLRDTLSELGGTGLTFYGPLARILQIGSSVIATYSSKGIDARTDRPSVSDVLVNGSQDPRLIRTDAAVLKLLWIEEKFSSGIFPDARNLKMFFRSSEDLSCQSCRDALALVEEEARRNNSTVAVRIRKDAWFDGDEFPLIYRFEPENPSVPLGTLRLPVAEMYYRSTREIFCSTRKELAPCALYGGWTAEQAIKAIGKAR